MAEQAAVGGLEDSGELFKTLDQYNWDSDKEFQAGLAAILGPSPSPSQINDLTIRARCFYYSRKFGQNVDFDKYKAHLASISSEPIPAPASFTPPSEIPDVASEPIPTPSYPTPFAEIVALIQRGAPIPGIKEIPPTVLSDQASKPAAAKRRKPWEKEERENVEVGGTFGDRRDNPIAQEEPGVGGAGLEDALVPS